MSSFKKRVQTVPIPGTRPSPYNSLPLLSTGLASLDDILGGGLPLSSSLLIEQDSPTSYAELLLKFWIAQGLESKQDVIVVTSGTERAPKELVKTLPGVDGGGSASIDEKSELEVKEKNEKLKIAFRYKGMKQHAVTVPDSASKLVKEEQAEAAFCSLFDLTTVRPLRGSDHAQLHLVDVDSLGSHSQSDLPADLYELLFLQLEQLIQQGHYGLPHDSTKPRRALRIAISSYGSPSWGLTTSTALYSFLHRLRLLLRSTSSSAVITFPSYLYSHRPSLTTRLEHASDGVLELQSFAASPTALAAFPRHSGLLRIPKLPSLGTLVAPSVRLSVLRGLGGAEGAHQNNLGFRVKRRRFIIETVNGDGPVGGEEPKKVETKVEVNVEKKKTDSSGGDSSSRVRFAGEEDEPKVLPKKKSVSAVIHSQPERYEF